MNYGEGKEVDLHAQIVLDNQAPFSFDVEKAVALRFKLNKKKSELLSRFADGYKNTSDNIITLLKSRYNFSPEILTANGNPSTKGDYLATLQFPEIDNILMLREVDKVLSYLKSWLHYNEGGTISHTCASIGAQTHRVSHSHPNIGSIPTKKSLGKACRRLFGPKAGTYQVGVDLSGIELRCLAHYLYRYDGGKYIEVINKGDIHQYNADAINSTREIAKVYIYAWLYGAGREALRVILGYISEKDVCSMQSEMQKNIVGLSKLSMAVANRVRHSGYIKAIDGREIRVPASYKAMNYLLQSTAAVIAKTWMVLADERLRERYGDKFKQLAFVHDEIQYQVDDTIDPKEFSSIVEQAALDAGKQLGLRVPVLSESKVGNSWAETH
jgi:DNA polymerase-1